MDSAHGLCELIQRLRLYEAPPPSDDDGDGADVDERGKVFSSLGLAETAAADAPRLERFRPKRAAVLICLFEGDLGELRVILTKRSSNLSTHSGHFYLFLQFGVSKGEERRERARERLEFSRKKAAFLGFTLDLTHWMDGLQVRCPCLGAKQKKATRMTPTPQRGRPRKK
ncbi:hypothetical protein B296_00033652 [Ensete ventricosum]|uniref:Uncharacterized protein n=1 Tax=Ensete ventricosum TaxID=4639 RepID=A0A426Z9N8_ENSVE|nr:hypothetical protein B296_00033652 [Ensete ventricosum]